MKNNTYDVIIIGSGPAGYTAAIYTSRANLNVALFEGLQPGGQLTITNDIENFPGFPEGISGPELMNQMKNQAIKFNTNIFGDTITSIDFKSKPFSVITEEGNTFQTKTIIIATGATAKTLSIPSEQTYWGTGISFCATCDGFFFRNKNVFVVGGGDTAMEDALYLSNLVSNVTIIHRRQHFRASQILLERVKNNKKINFMLDSVIDEFIGKSETTHKSLTGVRIRNVLTNLTTEYNIDGVFIAIGHHPNTELFKGILDMNSEGYLITSNNSSYTNIPGVFACGDCQDPIYRQAITAAGSGCKAGIDAERWIIDN